MFVQISAPDEENTSTQPSPHTRAIFIVCVCARGSFNIPFRITTRLIEGPHSNHHHNQHTRLSLPLLNDVCERVCSLSVSTLLRAEIFPYLCVPYRMESTLSAHLKPFAIFPRTHNGFTPFQSHSISISHSLSLSLP